VYENRVLRRKFGPKREEEEQQQQDGKNAQCVAS
jgi:hypothetical protein